jgi:predicted amidohydrolase YtcJ
MEYQRDVEKVFDPLRDHLTLRCRITLLDRAWPMDFGFGRSFANDDRLAVIGYKAFIDGTLGSRTARMLKDYSDDPGNRGLLVELAESGHLLEWARGVANAGLSPSMHAIGDEAVRIALDVIDAIGHDRRPRIEHTQQIDPSDIPRFKGRIASMQPLHKADDCRYVRARLGDDRLAGTFAFRCLRDAGAMLAFGSDWPVVSCDPLLGIRTAVTGLTLDDEVFAADQNLAIEEVIRAYTVNAAHCLGMADAGALAPGNVADLVMFDRDPFNADWSASPPRIAMTVCGGEIVYDADAKTQASSRAISESVAR